MRLLAIPFTDWRIALVIPLLMASRYFLMAGIAWFICYKPGLKKLERFRIQSAPPKMKQVWHEIKYSAWTIFIFSISGIFAWWLYRNDLTMLYSGEQKSFIYFIVSMIGVLFLHDTYFYWTHRLLHTKWIFRHVHAVHHRSVNPTPWAAYAFHPVEALIEAFFIFPLILIFPVHLYVFLLFIFLSLLMNVIGHLGFELIPSKMRHNILGKFLSSSTHHNLHHQKNRGNFSYYFTVWDRLMGTLQKETDMKKCRNCKVCKCAKDRIHLPA